MGKMPDAIVVLRHAKLDRPFETTERAGASLRHAVATVASLTFCGRTLAVDWQRHAHSRALRSQDDEELVSRRLCCDT